MKSTAYKSIISLIRILVIVISALRSPLPLLRHLLPVLQPVHIALHYSLSIVYTICYHL